MVKVRVKNPRTGAYLKPFIFIHLNMFIPLVSKPHGFDTAARGYLCKRRKVREVSAKAAKQERAELG